LRDYAFAIILHARQILLVKARQKDNWQLPGGRLEAGETPYQALTREVHEETGLEAAPVRLTGTYRREDGTVARVYEVRARGRLAGARREIVAQRWVSIRRALDMVGSGTRRRLMEGLARIFGTDPRRTAN